MVLLLWQLPAARDLRREQHAALRRAAVAPADETSVAVTPTSQEAEVHSTIAYHYLPSPAVVEGLVVHHYLPSPAVVEGPVRGG